MEVIEWLLSGCTSTRGNAEEDNEAGETAGKEAEEAGNDAAMAHRIVQMINQQDREGITAVFLAAYHNHQSLLALLLAHGADPNKQHKDGLSPLGVAIYRGHLTLVREVLLPHPRLDVDARDDAGGRTALFQAAYWGKTEALQLLLREKREGGGGADPMVMTKMATCAVQVARVKGHLGCVMLLEVRR
jgi:ankyrin repeat protein